MLRNGEMMKMRLLKVGDSSGLRRLLGLIIVIMLRPGLFPMQVRAANSGAAEAWMWPLGSSAGLRKFTSHLGRRDVQGGSLDHQGIDINCKTGTPVYASKSGVVCNIGDETTAGSRGTFVRINHRDGTYSQYQHLKFRSYTVKVNQEVRQGDLIGYSGKTGGIDKEHLHFQVDTDGYSSSISTIPMNTMPANECAFQGLSYGSPDRSPNRILGKWLNSWEKNAIYRAMGITDGNVYSEGELYPATRPNYYAGVVDKTWPQIYLKSRIRYYFAPTAKIDLTDRSTYPAFEETKSICRTYRLSVDFFQECLHDLGYNIAYDGFFGEGSVSTVKTFQARYGLSQTGAIDKLTWNKVMELMYAKYPEKPVVKPLDLKDPTTYPSFSGTVPAYVSGIAGYKDGTKFVQACLKDLGYSIDVDGYHGPSSTAVLKKFQKENQLTASGAIDRATWNCVVARMTEKYKPYSFLYTAGELILTKNTETAQEVLVILRATDADGRIVGMELIPCMLSAGQTQQKIALPDAWGECEMKAYALDSSNDSPLTASFVIHADTSNGSGLS